MTEKPTVLYLAGTACDDRLWNAVVQSPPHLAHRRPAYRPTDETIAEMATAVLAGVEGPLVLVCFSMGAMVGLEILRRDQARVEGIALISADVRPDSDARKLARSKLQHELSQLGIGEVFNRGLRRKYFPGRVGPVEAELLVVDMAATAGLEVFLRQLRALDSRPDTSALLSEITCPILLMRAADDPLCPIAAEEYLKEKASHTDCLRVDEGGHFLPLTTPTIVGKTLSKWIHDSVVRCV